MLRSFHDLVKKFSGHEIAVLLQFQEADLNSKLFLRTNVLRNTGFNLILR